MDGNRRFNFYHLFNAPFPLTLFPNFADLLNIQSTFFLGEGVFGGGGGSKGWCWMLIAINHLEMGFSVCSLLFPVCGRRLHDKRKKKNTTKLENNQHYGKKDHRIKILYFLFFGTLPQNRYKSFILEWLHFPPCHIHRPICALYAPNVDCPNQPDEHLQNYS